MSTPEAAARTVDVRARLVRDGRRLGVAVVWVLAIICSPAPRILLHPGKLVDGTDSRAYWLAWHGVMYTTGPMTPGAFLYSPAFAQVMWLPAQLPLAVFVGAFSLMDAALLWWLVRPLRWWWAVPIGLVLAPEMLSGNIFVPLAAMCVLGFRYPGAWAFSALTKVAPTVMPLWWLTRREWHSLAAWAATTLAVVTVSAAIAPDLWSQWVLHMQTWATQSGRTLGNPFTPPLIVRAPIGVALVAYGAHKGWRWTIPVGMLLCTPVFWLGSYALLAAIPRISKR